MIKLIKLLVLALSLVFMGLILTRQWNEIKSHDISLDYTLLSFSVLLLLFTFLLSAIGWHKILNKFGGKNDINSDIWIWSFSLLARYLPGGFWGYVGRVALYKEQGISLSIIMVGLYAETFLIFLASLVAGVPATASITGYFVPFEYLIVIGVAACLLLHPHVFQIIQNISGKKHGYLGKISIPSLTQMLVLFAYYLAIMIMNGIAFLLFVEAVIPLGNESWILTASTFPLAFCIGFILFIFPSGIGIRESAIYLLLLNTVGPVGAIIIAIGSRLWVIGIEVIYILLIYLFFRTTTGLPSATTLEGNS